MKRMFYGRLIIQPFIFFLILGATYTMSVAKVSLCTQTSIIESFVENINDHIDGCTICEELTTIETDLSIIDSKIDEIINTDLCGPTAITGTFSITQSGNYCVANSFTGSITISAGDVYLDLNERTITNDSGNTIEITDRLEQVTIRNGSVIGNDGNGIQVDAECDSITISNLVAIGSNNGIQVDNSCTRITISNVVASGSVQGIKFDTVDTSKIIECDMISNTVGLLLNNCNKIQVIDCASESNTQAGIALESCTNCYVAGCKVTGNGFNSSNIDTYGIVADSGSCNIIENCIVVDTEGVGNFTCPPNCFVPYMDPLVIQDCNTTSELTKTCGIALLNSEQNSKIINCEVCCTHVSGNCKYQQILSPNSIEAFGIALDGVSSESSTPALNLVATASVPTNNYVSSVAWLVNNGTNYIAINVTGITTNQLQIFEFDPNSTMSLTLIQATENLIPGNLATIAWLVCNDNNYIATAGGPTSGDSYLNIFEFNPTLDSLTSITTQTTGLLVFIQSIAWLIANDNNYLAIVGKEDDFLNSLQIFEFDAESSSLTTVTQIPVFSGNSLNDITTSVAWFVNDGHNYVAVGGQPAVDTDTVKVFEFLPTTSSLNLVAASDSIFGNGISLVSSVAWLACNDTTYLAIGGSPDDTYELTQVLNFNSTASTLTEVASFTSSDGFQVQTVAWFVCNGTNYLATGNFGDTDGVKILEFDPVSTTSLSQVAANSVSNSITSVAWLVSEGQAYLAVGTETNQFDILNFGCSVPDVLPSNNIVKNNLVYNTDGVGINGDSTANFIVGNVAYNNDPNYGTDVAPTHIFSGGIAATLPNPFLNSSFPPL